MREIKMGSHTLVVNGENKDMLDIFVDSYHEISDMSAHAHPHSLVKAAINRAGILASYEFRNIQGETPRKYHVNFL